MDRGQVIGLAVILDREFPVAADGEFQTADRAGMADVAHVEIGPSDRPIGLMKVSNGSASPLILTKTMSREDARCAQASGHVRVCRSPSR